MSGFRRGLIAAASVDPLKVPLTFTAEEAGSTVALNATGSPTISGLQYRMGKSGDWRQYTAGTVLTLPNVGNSVQFWNSAKSLSSSASNFAKFTLSGRVAAFGNVTSMVDYKSELAESELRSLFAGNSALTTPPRLDAITFCHRGSLARMFEGCFNLGKAPEFNPDMDSFSTWSHGCAYLFKDCTSLTSVKIPIKDSGLSNFLFNEIMVGCTGLKQIEVAFTSWTENVDLTLDWVKGVPSGGTFYKPSALPEEYGNNRIPTGWTVVNID